jgi:hypothetical protein
MSVAPPSAGPGLAALRRYADSAGRDVAERCDVCGERLDPDHGHVANVVHRTLLCACRACCLLFTHDGAGGSRFRAVPTRVVELSAEPGIAGIWETAALPIGLAFFVVHGADGQVHAFYPSAAGATEADRPVDGWAELTAGVPVLQTLTADVEALLVRRVDPDAPAAAVDAGAAATVAFLVPIDVCYELVGRVRQGWRGFHGGAQVWRDVEALFAGLAARAARGGGR